MPLSLLLLLLLSLLLLANLDLVRVVLRPRVEEAPDVDDGFAREADRYHLTRAEAAFALAIRILSPVLPDPTSFRVPEHVKEILAFRNEQFEGETTIARMVESTEAREFRLRESKTYLNYSVPSKDGKRRIKVIVNVPTKLPRRRRKKTRVIVYFHSGGGVVGNASTMMFYALNAKLRGILFSVDYRLAPEDPYPAGLDDCFEAAVFAINNAYSLFPTRVEGHQDVGPVDNLVLVGESAGGMMVASVGKRLIDAGYKIRLMMPLVPMLSPLITPSYLLNWNQQLLNAKTMTWYWMTYLNGTTSACVRDPVCAPALSRPEDLTGIAERVLVVAGSADVLYDDAKTYATALRAARVPVTFARVKGSHLGIFLFNKERVFDLIYEVGEEVDPMV